LDKAELLSKQFKSAFTQEPNSSLPDKGPSPHPDIHPFDITEEGVYKLVFTLNTHKACGPDQINAIFLKQTAEIVTPLLTKLFQLSINTGVILNDWKTAYVVPIFKKGDKMIAKNHCSISLISIASKLLEHILASNIMYHLEENSILYNLQAWISQIKIM